MKLNRHGSDLYEIELVIKIQQFSLLAGLVEFNQVLKQGPHTSIFLVESNKRSLVFGFPLALLFSY